MNTILRPRQFLARDERPVASVPPGITLLLVIALAVQVCWQLAQPPAQAQARALPPAPGAAIANLASLDDPVTASRVLMLWLQAFDNQPGISIPFSRLDYDRVINWLELCLDLDARSQYPLLAASRVYTLVPDAARQRKMLDFVYRQFFQDPDRRWVWLAHAVFVARYQLHDTDTALRYARALRGYAHAESIPFWARDMDIYILQDMGELQAARVLVGGLLDSGMVKDPNELRFLEQRLQDLEQR